MRYGRVAWTTLGTVLMAIQFSWATEKPVKEAPSAKSAANQAAVQPPAQPSSTDSAASTAEAPKEVTAAELRKSGDLQMKKGLTDKAIESYRQCIEKSEPGDTANGRIYMVLGKYSFEKQQYGEALDFFAKAGGKATEALSFKLMVAEALQKNGKNDSVAALLEPFAANPKMATKLNREMFRILGDAAVASGNQEKAAAWFGKYIVLGGVRTADMAYLLALEQEKKVPAKAKLAYEANIKKYPSDYRNFLRLGMLMSKSRATLPQALSNLAKAASLTDTVPSIWIEIGKVNASMGKRDEEREAYRTCLRADANNLEAKIRLGSALLESGSTDEAIPYLEGAHKQAPDSAAPMAALATAYLKSSKTKKAVELLQKLKTAQSANIEVRRQLVEAYQTIGDDKKALEEINGALEIERDYELLIAGAKLMVKSGKVDEAVAMLEEVLGMMPESIDALMIMAQAKRSANLLDEAVEIYKEVAVLDPKYAPALYERAEVHLAQSKVKWAEMFYLRALSADPQYALAEVGLAKLQMLMKNSDSAAIHLNRAETLAPDDPLVRSEIDKVRNPGRHTSSTAVQSDTRGKDGASGADEASTDEDSKKGKKRRRK